MATVRIEKSGNRYRIVGKVAGLWALVHATGLTKKAATEKAAEMAAARSLNHRKRAGLIRA